MAASCRCGADDEQTSERVKKKSVAATTSAPAQMNHSNASPDDVRLIPQHSVAASPRAAASSSWGLLAVRAVAAAVGELRARGLCV